VEAEQANFTLSVVAILLSAYSLVESARVARASQLAVLLSAETDGNEEYIYEIVNKGNGPAFFQSIEYFQNFEKLENKTFGDAIREVIGKAGIRCKVSTSHPAQKGVMAPGEAITLVRLTFAEDQREKVAALQRSQFGVRITYRSAFGGKKIFAINDKLSMN
jgi:hypothetical protein